MLTPLHSQYTHMQSPATQPLAKVPEVTLLFWLIKIAATTLGETGGDAVTMSWLGETTAQAHANGYLIGTCVFAAVFVFAVWLQAVSYTHLDVYKRQYLL